MILILSPSSTRLSTGGVGDVRAKWAKCWTLSDVILKNPWQQTTRSSPLAWTCNKNTFSVIMYILLDSFIVFHLEGLCNSWALLSSLYYHDNHHFNKENYITCGLVFTVAQTCGHSPRVTIMVWKTNWSETITQLFCLHIHIITIGSFTIRLYYNYGRNSTPMIALWWYHHSVIMANLLVP